MIDHVLVRSYIKQSFLLLAACSLTLFAFAWVRVWVVSLLDMGQFQTILEQFRQFEKLAPISFDALFTYQGRVGMTFDEPIVILCTVIWCISRGSDVVSGELGRGTMEMMLGQPISRGTLLWSHATVAVAGLALLCAMVWVGIAVGVSATTVDETVPPPSVEVPLLGWEIPLQTGDPVKESFPLSERVDVRAFGAATFNLFAFGFFLLGLSTLLSSLDRYRWRTVGVVMAIYVVQLVMFGLGKATEVLHWLQPLSFFNCYRPQKLTTLVQDGDLRAPWSLTEVMPEAMFPPLVYSGILVTLGGLCYLAAARVFEKRDLPAPL
ncbi:ABC transporter permease [Roseiconus nitratireducens]|uniref:ABC transporter permease n=1 Tax=Roseiconus nitratireducens TaxID=2605748 RepID=A0A5M6D1U9_9BACT|nr:ABC transporter permease subunit [Roseiconus nitratireducens]KAA5541481.1 ABC transporter permease [Roseiconus nitratireducens]